MANTLAVRCSHCSDRQASKWRCAPCWQRLARWGRRLGASGEM